VANEGLERLVALLQETPVPNLVPTLVGQLSKGVTLHELVAAGAVCNARAFGGHDYDGYHTFMAMAPAFNMAKELPEKERALPIIKVLHRNSRTMRSGPGKHPNRLEHVEPAEVKGDQPIGKLMLEATRAKRIPEADRLFMAASKTSLQDGYNELQTLVHDDVNVHRVVLAWRSWETIDFTGQEHARTLLRQSVHFCCDESRGKQAISTILPQLMDKYGFMDKAVGKKEADDAWVEQLSQTVYSSSREQGGRSGCGRAGGGLFSRSSGRGSLGGLCPPGAGRSRPGEERQPGEADGQRSRRLGGRPRLRLGQRLAAHRSGQQTRATLRQSDRRSVPHGGPDGPSAKGTLSAGRGPGTGEGKGPGRSAEAGRGKRSAPAISAAPAPWSSVTARRRATPRRCSLCCCASRSARMERCTPRSITARSARSSLPFVRRSVGGT